MITTEMKNRLFELIGGEAVIYPVKKHLKRKNDGKKPSYDPCWLVCRNTRILLVETESGNLSHVIDMTGKIDPAHRSKFENGIHSYKIGNRISD